MRKFNNINKIFLFALIAMLFVFSLNMKVYLNQKNKVSSPLALKKSVELHSSTSTSTPKPIPTQSPTPTPTPTPSGYCLYVPVLFYHHIDAAYFEQHMSYLSSHGYVSISALDLVNALRSHGNVPANSIVVTLDDGYADQFTNALPVAKKYGIRLNLLIASGLINNPGFMDWGQVNEIKNSGGYILNHTWSHFSLPSGSIEKQKYEVETGKSQIEQYTGQKVELLGYPYGSFDNNTIALLQQEGYLGAVTTLPGTVQCDSYILALRRTRIGNAPLSYYGF